MAISIIDVPITIIVVVVAIIGCSQFAVGRGPWLQKTKELMVEDDQIMATTMSRHDGEQDN